MDATESLWTKTTGTPAYPPFEARLDEFVDVVIVGGGITGLTAALLLAREGRRVILVEARSLGSGVSGRSTTHLTEALDSRYFELESDFGKEGARLAAESTRAAIEKVASIVARDAIDCGFVRRPGYLFTESEADLENLEREGHAARAAGIAVENLARAPLPFAQRGALLFPNQAQMHIQRYLAKVAENAAKAGARIHEQSRVIAIDDGEPCRVILENGSRIRAKTVFVATHAPLNRVFLQTKVHAYRSYVLAYRGTRIEDGLFWDMADPYHYLSSFPVDGEDWLLVGGGDHRTGETSDTQAPFEELRRWSGERIAPPGAEPTLHWSSQVEEPVDGLPFIGRNSASKNVFVATGFSGNGTTFGTIAAMLLVDHVADRPNPWAGLYTATRVKPVASAKEYVRENVDFPIHLLTDYLHPPQAKNVSEIARGEGKTVRVKGERLAVYRDPAGCLHAVTSVCTHLGCLVAFNKAEKSWDCPCHGSRFGIDGKVHDGPATRNLETREVDDNAVDEDVPPSDPVLVPAAVLP